MADFVIDAAGEADLPAVRRLIRDYAAALPIDLAYQSLDAELAGLPGVYAPPTGALLVARRGGAPCGCVAVRPFAPGQAELKRLFVAPAARGAGVARALAAAAMAAARDAGYRTLLLDTLASMAAARALYRSLGFAETAAYAGPAQVPDLVFMRLDLA